MCFLRPDRVLVRAARQWVELRSVALIHLVMPLRLGCLAKIGTRRDKDQHLGRLTFHS